MKNSLILFGLLLSLVVTGLAQTYSSPTFRKASQKLLRGDRAGAIAILDDAIRKNQDRLEAYKFRGDIKAMSGDLDGAIADFTSALELAPNDASTYQKRAEFRRFKRDSAGALQDYDLAIANGSKTERNYVGRAEVKRDLGDLDGALADLQNALALNPELASAHISLSFIYERKGELDLGLLDLQDFLERYERNNSGKLPTAPASDGTMSLAIKREGLEKDGSQAFMLGTGRITVKDSGNDDVEQQTAKLEQTMNISLAYLTLGRLYSRKGEYDTAILNFDKGLSIRNDDPIGYQQRAEAKIMKGDLEGAIADLTVAVNSAMQLPGVHFNRAILLTLQGRDEDAEKELQLHLRQFPNATREKLDERINEAKKLRAERRLEQGLP